MPRISDAQGNEAKLNSDGSINTKLVGSLANVQTLKLAIPSGPLKASIIYPWPVFTVSSIGVDGVVYGWRDKKISKSADAFGTTPTDGWDISTVADVDATSIVWVGRTTAGYVIVARATDSSKSTIWFSTDFAGVSPVFAKVATLVNGAPIAMTISASYGDIDVLLVGEYQTSGIADLWGSFDGGATWAIILSALNNSSAVNRHFHMSSYDRYAGRIWSACGDEVNTALRYSDDLGVTWKTVTPAPLQMTLIAPLPTKVVFTPDSALAIPSIMSITRDFVSDTVGSELFTSRMELPVTRDTTSNYRFGTSYVVSGSEIYILITDGTGTEKRHYIVASGDGGLSWYLVYTIDLSKFDPRHVFSLVGPDVNGFIYVSYHMNLAQKIFKFPLLTWITK